MCKDATDAYVVVPIYGTFKSLILLVRYETTGCHRSESSWINHLLYITHRIKFGYRIHDHRHRAAFYQQQAPILPVDQDVSIAA